LSHEAKLVAILALVRHYWFQWSRDKYATYKKTSVSD